MTSTLRSLSYRSGSYQSASIHFPSFQSFCRAQLVSSQPDVDQPFCFITLRCFGSACSPRFVARAVDGVVQVAKTGMGSSAALITSLVGCLLQFFGAAKLPAVPDAVTPDTDAESNGREHSMQTVHNLAQICHAAAQKKIGSGFDVSSAVYGSHIYTRFSPQLIAPILDAGGKQRAELLSDLVLHTQWDCDRQPLSLPSPFRLLMGDVQGGSSTPAMVSVVESNP